MHGLNVIDSYVALLISILYYSLDFIIIFIFHFDIGKIISVTKMENAGESITIV